MALDILSAGAPDSERFVLELCDSFKAEALARGPAAFLHAKKAFALASIEQLVPVLSDDCIRMDVYPLCLPHLSDSSHRETYESAHSVMLAIFASHARRMGERDERASAAPAFAEQIVPFYTQCLIDNAHDGKLSTAQLCLAYAALVRSASTFTGHGEADASEHTEGDVIAWFCIETLLAAIRNASAAAPSSSMSSRPRSADLHLTLIATLPALSLALLPRVLEEVAEIVGLSAHRRCCRAPGGSPPCAV
ncbi:hypothetical protein A0H81_08652 [Grifola frondosa]|uniref:Uncharacterized protein n=1 Tax=Grifola frondosa TaxID=5627 RepID=A0A1C7M2R5_GRIFR|nr:hypothetical protein A0H81_08652 [Grifola frondosa]